MTQINLIFKGNYIESFTLDGDITIGSDSASHIYIDSLAVQPTHATVSKNGDEYTITGRGDDARVLVNGAKVATQQLKDGDQIQIGKHTLEFIGIAPAFAEVPSPDNGPPNGTVAAAPAQKRAAFVQLLNGSNVGKTISLAKNLTHLGKPGVQTAVIARREDGYFLSHLEGAHSPRVNKKSIGENSHELKSGDSIQIGNVKLLFSIS